MDYPARALTDESPIYYYGFFTVLPESFFREINEDDQKRPEMPRVHALSDHTQLPEFFTLVKQSDEPPLLVITNNFLEKSVRHFVKLDEGVAN